MLYRKSVIIENYFLTKIKRQGDLVNMENPKTKLVRSVYISSACNKCPKALDWGGKQNQLICAMSNSVALFSGQEPFEIKCTFNKHTDRVNCVKWISSTDFIDQTSLRFSEFISASKDKSLVVWRGNDFEVYSFI